MEKNKNVFIKKIKNLNTGEIVSYLPEGVYYTYGNSNHGFLNFDNDSIGYNYKGRKKGFWIKWNVEL